MCAFIVFFLTFSFQPQIVHNLFLFSGDLSLTVFIQFVLQLVNVLGFEQLDHLAQEIP